MKGIVIYKSKTGFTKQYATWISSRLNYECVPLDKGLKMNLSEYDQVIYGGWVMGNLIIGLDKILKVVTPTAVFAVGSTPKYEEVVDKIIEQNHLEVPFFYMEGGFHFDQLGFVQKTLLKTIKKSVSKQENKDRQGEFMASYLGTSFDHSQEDNINELVTYISE